jgi:glyoxylase-like metal-dependent hydrolase (beta-lactamase superfamily II)
MWEASPGVPFGADWTIRRDDGLPGTRARNGRPRTRIDAAGATPEWHDSTRRTQAAMKLQQVSENCFAVLNERNRVCDANSGLINLGGGVVIDTQSDLPHGRQMIELFGKVWRGMPKRVINTHEDGDHVWGNQLFEGAEIIAHRTVRELMPHVANPRETQELLKGADHFLPRMLLKALHPGALAIARQLQQDFDFDGIKLVLPTTVFDERHVLDLDGTEVHLIYVGPCHQIGDTIIHVPKERVVFAGDVIFRQCTPMGWNGTYEKWLKVLDLIIWLDPEVIVPGHGPVCGIEGAMDMKAYLEYVREESRRWFDQGLTSLEASKRIDFGPYGGYRAPARLYMNVERAYREFRNEAADARWDHAKTFDAIYTVAQARGIEVEF